MKILSFLLRRSFYSICLLTVVVILNFFLLQLAPGSIVDTIAGEMGGISEEMRQELEQEYELDKPILIQLVNYLKKAAQGDLGYSFYMKKNVTQALWERFPATALLFILSVIISTVLGTLIGNLAAIKPDGLFSAGVTIFSLAAYSSPAFWLGIILLLCFGIWIPIFPVSGMISMRLISEGGTFWEYVWDISLHLTLPLITLSLIYLGQYSRLARASMLEILKTDYIRTARAKGMPEYIVVFKHALRNALLPVITATGIRLGQVFSGAVIVEAVFGWPGLGQLAFQSVLRRDYPIVMGILIFATMIVIMANILTDFAYRVVDPRIKTS